MKKQKQKVNFSAAKWYATFYLGLFIFPIGMLLSVIFSVVEAATKIRSEKAMIRSGLILSLAAAFMVIGVAVISTMGEAALEELLLSFSLPFIQAAYIFVFYFALKKRNDNIAMLLQLINIEHITSVETIAGFMNEKVAKTEKRVEFLIRKNILPGAHLDKETKTVTFEESDWAGKKAICRTCGAAITVDFGRTLVCEYCGGILSVEKTEE